MTPCPCCDVEEYGPLEGLALGVALGAAFGDMHKVTELCCPAHRTKYIMAMLHADVRANTVATPSEPVSEEKP